jgi:pimeloyl-ACP methyl ester carboxylesterase
MARFLFVAGAFHGAWCWEFVIPLLEAKGHRAEVVELPGMGADLTPLAETSFADWAKTVAAAVEAGEEKPILVGHSRGGVVISQVAELVPEKLHMNVYLAALLVGDGETALDQPEMPGRAKLELQDLASADGIQVEPEDELRAAAYEHASAELAARAGAHVTPEPVFALTTALALSEERYGSVPRAYIECLHDKVVPLEVQRAMQALQPCKLVRAIATDHCPTYSAPALLADTLDDIAWVA